MFDIHELATLTAKRARELKLRPNQVVLTICAEAGVDAPAVDSIKKMVLQECGRRGGKAPRAKRKKHGQHVDTHFEKPSVKYSNDAAMCEASLIKGIPEEDR